MTEVETITAAFEEVLREVGRLRSEVRSIRALAIDGDRLADGVTGVSKNVAALTSALTRVEEVAKVATAATNTAKSAESTATAAVERANVDRKSTARQFITVSIAVIAATIFAVAAGLQARNATRGAAVVAHLAHEQCLDRNGTLHVTIDREKSLATTDPSPGARQAHLRSVAAYQAALRNCDVTYPDATP